jgi:hypothetical protein
MQANGRSHETTGEIGFGGVGSDGGDGVHARLGSANDPMDLYAAFHCHVSVLTSQTSVSPDSEADELASSASIGHTAGGSVGCESSEPTSVEYVPALGSVRGG